MKKAPQSRIRKRWRIKPATKVKKSEKIYSRKKDRFAPKGARDDDYLEIELNGKA